MRIKFIYNLLFIRGQAPKVHRHILYPVSVLLLILPLIEDSPNINHTKFGVSNSNPLAPPLVQICTHVCANNFWTVRARNKSSWKFNHLSKSSPKWTWRFSVFRPNLVCVMTTMIWGYLHSFSKNEKFIFLLINSEWFGQKSQDSVQHIEQYPIFPYWPFWALAILNFDKKILCFTTALLYRQETYCVSSAPCPEGTQKVSGQCHIVFKKYNGI